MRILLALLCLICVASAQNASNSTEGQQRPHLRQGHLLPTNTTQRVRELALEALNDLVVNGFEGQNFTDGDRALVERYKRRLQRQLTESKLEKLALQYRKQKSLELAREGKDDPLSKHSFKKNLAEAEEVKTLIPKRKRTSHRLANIAIALGTAADKGSEYFEALMAVHDANMAAASLKKLENRLSLLEARIHLYRLHHKLMVSQQSADSTEDPTLETQELAKASSLQAKLSLLRTRIGELEAAEKKAKGQTRKIRQAIRADQLAEVAYLLNRRATDATQRERAFAVFQQVEALFPAVLKLKPVRSTRVPTLSSTEIALRNKISVFSPKPSPPAADQAGSGSSGKKTNKRSLASKDDQKLVDTVAKNV